MATETEKRISEHLVSKGYRFLCHCANADYDLKMETPSGEVITIEIKEDFLCKETGNIAVEYHCRQKPSGIATSRADFYLYRAHEPNGEKNLYVIETSSLKEMIEKKLWHRTVNGGDGGSNSLNYLFTLGVIKENFTFIGKLEGEK